VTLICGALEEHLLTYYSRPQNWGPARKSEPKFNKTGEDLLRTNTPKRAKFHRCQPNGVREKRYNFLHPSVFWRPRGTPGPKFTNLSGDVEQGPLYQAAEFRLRPTTYEISAAKVRRFRRRCDRQTNKKKCISEALTQVAAWYRGRKTTSGRQTTTSRLTETANTAV